MMMCSKRSSSPAAADILEGIDDLLIEIFLFLPALILVKFKSVSKRWRSLISAPSFCRRHTLHHPRRPPETQTLFILNAHKSSKHYVSNPRVRKLFPSQFDLGFSLVEILRSCNGLLLLRCRETKRSTRSSYYVFNPTTKQGRDLSPFPTCTNPTLYLMFDPSQSPHYKVICFTGYRSTNTSRNLYLYDSESHNWKREDGEIVGFLLGVRKGIQYNGAIYFHRFRHYSTRFIPEGNVSEAILGPPRHHCRGGQKNYMMESNGFLLCLTLSSENGSNLLHVSETKGTESGWSKKYLADMNPVLGKGVSCLDAMELLGVNWGEKAQDLLVLSRLNREIMVYRFCDCVFEVVVDCNSQESQKEKPLWSVKDVHHFIHTLALV